MPFFRPLCLVLLLLLCTCVRAQLLVRPDTIEPTVTVADSVTVIDTLELLTTVAWRETESSLHPGYLFVLTREGNFDEDAGEGRRKFPNLLGRWVMDGDRITLKVDAFMAQDIVHRRYRQERDYAIPYRLVEILPHRLILEDALTGKQRRYEAVDVGLYLEQAEKRLPKPAPKPSIFTLPDLGG